MKEIIVIENSVDVSIMKRHPQWEYLQFLIPDKQYKREQVPETFEELKELCKDITVDLKVCKDGTIYCKEHCIAKNRTPQQMWQIIKNLIGEE
jgi:hypothetical protein